MKLYLVLFFCAIPLGYVQAQIGGERMVVEEKGSSYHENVNDTTLAKYVQVAPVYPGGGAAKQEYFVSKQSELEKLFVKGGSSKLFAKLIIEKDGKISNVFIVKGISNAGFDEKIVELILAMPHWKPAENGGKLVRYETLEKFDFGFLN